VTAARFETWREGTGDDALAFAAVLPDIEPEANWGGWRFRSEASLPPLKAVQDERIAALVSESAGVSNLVSAATGADGRLF
jgi:hypothetical protein